MLYVEDCVIKINKCDGRKSKNKRASLHFINIQHNQKSCLDAHVYHMNIEIPCKYIYVTLHLLFFGPRPIHLFEDVINKNIATVSLSSDPAGQTLKISSFYYTVLQYAMLIL